MSYCRDGLVGYEAASTQWRYRVKFPISIFGFVCDDCGNDTSTGLLRPLTRNKLE